MEVNNYGILIRSQQLSGISGIIDRVRYRKIIQADSYGLFHLFISHLQSLMGENLLTSRPLSSHV